MSILACGSMAYDNIMSFDGHFKDHILPNQIHILNVSFLVPKMRREYGGCAGNIAYNLKLLGNDPLIMATVGEDAEPYLKRLDALSLSTRYIRTIAGSLTAQAFITTDNDDNQITAFHPGAMSFSHENDVTTVKEATLAIVSPDGRDGMLKHAEGLAKNKVPFIFDLGQAMPLFSGDDILHFLNLAEYACFNDYEAEVSCSRTGCSLETLATKVRALIVTLGAKGSKIYTDGRCIDIPCVLADQVVDPTGAGDAYRAGLLYGIHHRWDWKKTGQLAALMGAIKVAHRGPQNHAPHQDEIARRYQKAFNETLW